MTVDRHAVKLRELVEGAGFTLEPSVSLGRFLIMSKRGRQVAIADTDSRGFRAVFPDTQRRSSTPTELVDDLEDWTAWTQKRASQ
jgi:hypothetical protein